MSKKYLVSLIKKMAQGVPAHNVDLEGPAPAQTKPGTTVPGTQAVVAGDPGIKSMQEALVALSNKFTSQRTDIKPPTPGKPQTKSFADYVSNGLKDPGMGDALQQMQKLTDTKVGTFPIDGKWGPKTFSALSSVAKLGAALLNIGDSFRLQSKVYKREYLDGFNKIVGNQALSQKDKVAVAPNLTENINAISALYTELMNTIMASSALKEQIQGAPEQKQEVLSPQLIEALNNKYKSFVISFQTAAGIQQKSITVNDFANLAALQAWKEKNLPNVPTDLVITQLNQQIDKIK